MSVLNSSDVGWYISHEKLINKFYEDLNLSIKPELFKIHTPYKNPKKKQSHIIKDTEVLEVLNLFERFKSYLDSMGEFSCKNCGENSNKEAQNCADNAYKTTTNEINNIVGSNMQPSVVKKIKEETYVFPENCKFYCKEVAEIDECLSRETYDLLLLDPPWWNKYIRRKRKINSNGYDMLYNTDLQNIPVEKLLKEDGLIVVWVTNSHQNYDDLVNKVFKKWGIQSYVTWYWIKITQNGEPICEFSEPPRKQPYEKLIIGYSNKRGFPNPPNKKVILSVPSAIHSHKPPLNEILKKFVPPDAVCLEIFARYLMPGWTSYGLEAVRFQHASLYNFGEKLN